MLFGNFRDLHLLRVQIFLAIGIISMGVRTLGQEGAFAPPGSGKWGKLMKYGAFFRFCPPWQSKIGQKTM